MVKVIFKNVGQGDSIILEWERDQKKRIAILDCNLYQNANPILEHIIQNQVTEIEYLILSHPHFDHFSGFYELLVYCKKNSIKVNYFLHTCSSIPEFLKTAVKSVQAKKELAKLFQFIHQNFEDMGLKVGPISADSASPSIPLNSNLSITVLAPTHKEINNYISHSNFKIDLENDPNNNSYANYLSTLLKLNTPNGYILLTSDTEKSTLIRVDKKTNVLSEKLILAQIPHHGAAKNHNNTFWKKRNRLSNCPAIISVGPNNYNHPSNIVTDFFLKHDFELHFTWVPLNPVNENTIILDVFSNRIIPPSDKVFEF